jgi:hypothetical protein
MQFYWGEKLNGLKIHKGKQIKGAYRNTAFGGEELGK